MWYPNQTSMMAVHVALARFLEKAGLMAAFGKYPYWYLGSTPFRYLTGPVLPGILVGLHRAFPGLTLFELFFGLLGVFGLLGEVGVFFLVRTFQRLTPELLRFTPGVSLSSKTRDSSTPGVRVSGFNPGMAAFFYLLGPLAPVMFSFSDGLSIMAFSVVPWALLFYLRLIRGIGPIGKENKKNEILFCILTTFLLLLDISILPRLVLGMAAIFLATQDWKKAEKKIKKSTLLVAYSLLLVTIWYGLGYWWQILLAPSFAGKRLISVIGLIGQILPIGLAIGLAIVGGNIVKTKNRLTKFCFYWLFIFGFLTFVRFISDWDFVLDWSAYYLEIQLGLGILGAVLVDGLLKKHQKPKTTRLHQLCWKHCGQEDEKHKPKNIKIFAFLICVFSFLFLVFYFTFKRYVLSGLQRDIKTSVEYRKGEKLAEIVGPDDVVFLSGTLTFWTNAFFDIRQVRGGNDKAAVHPDWDKAAWELREGEDIEKSLKWLREFKVKYLVVHTEDSKEYYHDFKHPEKFERVEDLEKIYDEKGDRIYRINF